jgi:hypothetical protein
VNDEQASSHLCARVLGSPEGESHDCFGAREKLPRSAFQN